MSHPGLERLGGVAAIAGGALVVLTAVVGLVALDYDDYTATAMTWLYAVTAALSLLAAILVLGGSVALYTAQAETAGGSGVFGFVVAFLGNALMIGPTWFETFASRTVMMTAPEFFEGDPVGPFGWGMGASYVLAALGWLLFAVATIRAGRYPGWAVIVLIFGAVLLGLPVPGTEIVLGIAVAWLGYALVTGAVRRDVNAA